MTRILILGLIAVGCARGLPAVTTPLAPQSHEMRQVEAIIQAWNERGDLPPLDAPRLRELLVTDPPDMAGYRHLCPESAGCLRHWNLCDGPFGGMICGGESLAVISPHDRSTPPRPWSTGTRLSLIRHEAVHRAEQVAGIGGGHNDRRVWPYWCSAERMRIPEAIRPPPSAEELACRAPTVEERARTIANAH